MAAPKHYSMGNNTAANDITGDRIQTKGTLSDQGRRNFDNIDWGARARKANKIPDDCEVIIGVDLASE